MQRELLEPCQLHLPFNFFILYWIYCIYIGYLVPITAGGKKVCIESPFEKYTEIILDTQILPHMPDLNHMVKIHPTKTLLGSGDRVTHIL